MNLFKQITYTSPTDCFEVNNTIVYTTLKGKASKAIGKAGVNIKRIKDALKKDVKVMEGANNPISLTKNFLFPSRPSSVELVNNDQTNQKEIHIQFKNARDRRFLLDYGQKNLKLLKEVIARYYEEVSDVRVL